MHVAARKIRHDPVVGAPLHRQVAGIARLQDLAGFAAEGRFRAQQQER